MLSFRKLKDPRVPGLLSITSVDVAEDGSHATVFIVPITNPSEEDIPSSVMKECIKGLESATGLLRRDLAKALTIRSIPTLKFKEDKGLSNTLRVHDLLKKIGNDPVS